MRFLRVPIIYVSIKIQKIKFTPVNTSFTLQKWAFGVFNTMCLLASSEKRDPDYGRYDILQEAKTYLDKGFCMSKGGDLKVFNSEF